MAEVTQGGRAGRQRGGQVLRSTDIYLQEGGGAQEVEKDCLGQEEARRFEGIESFQKESV